VILPDVNLLIYAYNREAPRHTAARQWWEAALNADEPVAIPWVTMLGFIRLMTHRAVLVSPLPPKIAIGHVRSWLERPNVRVMEPGPRHLELLEQAVHSLGTAGPLTTDAHLAVLAIEHQCQLYSNDADFVRFPGLRWVNPIAEA
jgi:hypothetical protein